MAAVAPQARRGTSTTHADALHQLLFPGRRADDIAGLEVLQVVAGDRGRGAHHSSDHDRRGGADRGPFPHLADDRVDLADGSVADQVAAEIVDGDGALLRSHLDDAPSSASHFNHSPSFFDGH